MLVHADHLEDAAARGDARLLCVPVAMVASMLDRPLHWLDVRFSDFGQVAN